jgi:hypothetical protein
MNDNMNVPGWRIHEDFFDIKNNRSGNQRTAYEKMGDVLDDLDEDMSQAVPENKWTELLIYLIEALERKAKDKG